MRKIILTTFIFLICIGFLNSIEITPIFDNTLPVGSDIRNIILQRIQFWESEIHGGNLQEITIDFSYEDLGTRTEYIELYWVELISIMKMEMMYLQVPE